MRNIYIIAGQSNAQAMDSALRAQIQARDPGAIFVTVASAGAPLTWGRSGTDWYQAGDMQATLVAEVARVMRANPGAQVQSMVWVQGEADTYDFARWSSYASQFQTLLSGIDAGLRAALPGVPASALDFEVVISQLARMAPTAADRTAWSTVIDQQRRLDAGSDRIVGVDPDAVARAGGFVSSAMFKDPLHYSTAFIDRLAGALADRAVVDRQVTTPQTVVTEGTDAAERIVGRGIDVIRAGNGADTILAGTGDDSVSGGWGDDWIDAGEGRNMVWGVNGNDTIIGGSDADNIFGGLGRDLLSGGMGNDVIDGGDDADVIDGGFGRDRLSGGTGNDTIRAGAGADTVTGGAGADVFVFADAASIGMGVSRDTITDFEAGVDRIDLRGMGLVLQASDFAGGGRASVWFDAGARMLLGDQNGDRVADWMLELQGLDRLTARDLIL